MARMWARLRAHVFGGLLLLWGAGPAFAQPSPSDRASALFTEARTLIKTGDYVSACPKLAESMRLDPARGTLMNLADCEAKCQADCQ
jgi:hypothetical protein